MLPNPLDFERICRLCLSNSENLIDLFSSEEDFITLLKSMTVLSFTANDDLPQHICPFCSHQIQTTRHFILKCQESDQKLRLSLENQSAIKCDESTFGCDTNDALNSSKVQTQRQPKNKNSRSKRNCKSSNLNNRRRQIEDKKSNKTTKIYECEYCRLEYSCNESLCEHMKTHNQEDNADISHAERLLATVNNSTKAKHVCSLCNKRFAKSINLERHKAIHENKQNYFQCTVCGKQMKHVNHFKIHIRSHRNSSTNSTTPTDVISDAKKQYLCSTCGKACTSRSNLAVHTRRHTGVMTNFCSICGKGYPRSTDLTIHMRKHTGEKPFQCTICSRAFARSDKLTIHIRTHTGEKPYHCNHCNRSFAQRNDLISHQRRNVCGSMM